MENEDLEAFLERWKRELLYRPPERPGDVNEVDGNPIDGVREPGADGHSWLLPGDTRSDCASAAARRQEGWVSPPRYETQATTSWRKRQRSSSAEEPPCKQPRNDVLVQQLIEDLVRR